MELRIESHVLNLYSWDKKNCDHKEKLRKGKKSKFITGT